jgi:Zn-dependent protease
VSGFIFPALWYNNPYGPGDCLASGLFESLSKPIGEHAVLGLTLAGLIARAITLIIAFTIHECAHAWTANRLGDSTARYMGRLTLNPRPHIDPLGMILGIIYGIGWAKPTPVNPYRLRYGPVAGMALVSLAGPLSNLGMALLFAAIWRLAAPVLSVFGANGKLIPTPVDLLYTLVFLNLLLLIFNLIPIPPLDGFSVLSALVPRTWAYQLQRIEPYGPMILLGVFVLSYLGLPVLQVLLLPAGTLFGMLWG